MTLAVVKRGRHESSLMANKQSKRCFNADHNSLQAGTEHLGARGPESGRARPTKDGQCERSDRPSCSTISGATQDPRQREQVAASVHGIRLPICH